jgi:L,D-transpeptidase YcbB
VLSFFSIQPLGLRIGMNKRRRICNRLIWVNRVGLLLFWSLLLATTSAQQSASVPDLPVGSRSSELNYPTLVYQLLTLGKARVHWLSPGEAPQRTRNFLLNQIDSAAFQGLDEGNYHPEQIARVDFLYTLTDSVKKAEAMAIFADAVLTYCKDLYHGRLGFDLLSFDELSPAYLQDENAFLIKQLSNIETPEQCMDFLHALEPTTLAFATIKRELCSQLQYPDSHRIKALSASLNYFRWINHFHFEKYVLVNIATAQLFYYEHDSLALSMKTIMGKPSTPTPRIGTRCTNIIVYPYWNVPRKIALTEILPRVQESPAFLDEMNMQVLDAKGHLVEAQSINWKRYNRSNFPFSFRQSTGCDNSLGVLKFNLSSPYSVYMHDTNLKGAFLESSRYLSHGCIRIEKPIELANLLIGPSLDSNFLKSCLKDQQPRTVELSKPIPVLVVYQLALPVDNQGVEYEKDIYHLLR